MKRLSKGVFVVFEGIDGSGKTTALVSVAKRLRERGYEVVETGIGGDPFSSAILNVLKDPLSACTDKTTQTLLINAIRRHNLQTVVIPAIERGAIVLCDRFVLSTRYYQDGCKMIESMHEQFCTQVIPDVTLVLNVTPETAVARLDRRGTKDRFDEIDMATRRHYQKIILDWLHAHPTNAVGICAMTEPEIVADRVENEVLKKVYQYAT